MYVLSVALFIAMFLLMSQVQGALYAYLDPGTGSVAIQVLLGTVVAVLAAVRLYWDRVKAFLRRRTTEADVASESR